jgi:hypothetical protein
MITAHSATVENGRTFFQISTLIAMTTEHRNTSRENPLRVAAHNALIPNIAMIVIMYAITSFMYYLDLNIDIATTRIPKNI